MSPHPKFILINSSNWIDFLLGLLLSVWVTVIEMWQSKRKLGWLRLSVLKLWSWLVSQSDVTCLSFWSCPHVPCLQAGLWALFGTSCATWSILQDFYKRLEHAGKWWGALVLKKEKKNTQHFEVEAREVVWSETRTLLLTDMQLKPPVKGLVLHWARHCSAQWSPVCGWVLAVRHIIES